VKYTDPDGRESEWHPQAFNSNRFIRFYNSNSSTVLANTVAVLPQNTINPSTSIADRVRQTEEGPCLAMSYMGVAQTLAGRNLTAEQVNTLLAEPAVWDGTQAGVGGHVIGRALELLNFDNLNINIRVDTREGQQVDPNAIATVRNVASINDPRGHWQEGTSTGGFHWDPWDGSTDTGRQLSGIRNIYITPRSNE
jgi:hypothetical protein